MPQSEPVCSQETSGASPRKRLSGQLFSKPLKPALLSGRRRPRRRFAAYFQRTTPSPREPAVELGNRAREYEMRRFPLAIPSDNLQTR